MKKKKKNTLGTGPVHILRPKHNQGPLISACMIVKNEEHFLPQCLRSIRDLVDEIVIVDTGSTDNTIQIAERFGARIYRHPWENDFSKHRNQSLSYAKGDWIFVIDADEKLDPASVPLVRNFLAKHNPEVISVYVRSYMDRGKYYNEATSPRLFKNNIGMKYSGIVHNQLDCAGRVVAFLKAVIWHYGYDLEGEKKQKKQERTLNLLLRQSEAKPDHVPTIHHLAVSYFAQEQYEKAYKTALKVRSLLKDDLVKRKDSAFAWTYFILVASLAEMQRFDEAEGLCREGLQFFKDSVDLHFCMAFISLGRNDYHRALYHIDKYFLCRQELALAPEKFGFVVFEKANKVWEAYKIKGMALAYLDRKAEALEAFEKSVTLAPETIKDIFISSIGKVLYRKGFEQEAIYFWEQLPATKEFEEDLKMSALLLMKHKKWPKAVQRLGLLAGINPREAFYFKGLALMEMGDYEKAADCFRQAHKVDPNWEKNLVNWGAALERSGSVEAAIKKYKQALEVAGGEDSMAHKNLGYIYVRQGKLDLAIPCLEKAIKIAPDDVHLHLTLARSYLEAAEIEQLVAVCDKILHLLDIPASLVLDSISQLANLFLVIAQRLLDRQDLACFDLAFDVAKLLGPADADRLKSLARSASLYNEYNRAAGILETALILNPKDPEVMELIKSQIKRLQH